MTNIDKDKVKVGIYVRYMTTFSDQIKTGDIIALATVTDHRNKNFIGKQIGYVEFDKTCQPDMVFIEDMIIIES